MVVRASVEQMPGRGEAGAGDRVRALSFDARRTLMYGSFRPMSDPFHA
jgi:hypothetical protein